MLKTVLTAAFLFALAVPTFAQKAHYYATQEELKPLPQGPEYLVHNGYQFIVSNIYNKPNNEYMVFITAPAIDTLKHKSQRNEQEISVRKLIYGAHLRLESNYQLTLIKQEPLEEGNANIIAEAQLESVLLEAVLHVKNSNVANYKSAE